jgi:release factor glutamine methyltransferase
MQIPSGSSVKAAQIALQAGGGLDPLEARILLCHATGLSRVQLITQADKPLTEAEAAALTQLAARRLAGEPIAYLVGRREFYGLDFQVSSAVLIPRPDTELLVELALERLPRGGALLDMGTGSGAIAVAVAHTRTDARVTAIDVSAAALAVAQANAATHGATVHFLRSDWFAALDTEARFDVIASNPPYIAAGDAHLAQGDLRFEPAGALTDGADGLAALRTIAAGAHARLAPGGWLLLEHGWDQAQPVRALLAAHGFTDVQSWRDLPGIERASGGRRPIAGS